MKWLTAIGFSLFALSAQAQDLAARFAEFVDQFDAAPASMVVLAPDGKLHAKAEVGQSIDAPAPIQSVTKTLAGHCLLAMQQLGRLDLSDPLRAHVDRRGIDWSGPAGGVSLNSLLSHTSGIGPDSTQRDLFARNLTDPKARMRILNRVAKRRLRSDKFFYNNENYIALGAVLNHHLGEDSLSGCQALDPALGAMDSLGWAAGNFGIGWAGGLDVAPRQLAAFFQSLTYDPIWPKVQVAKGVHYGPGIAIRNAESAPLLLHRGGLCTPIAGHAENTIAIRFANGWAVVVTYSGCGTEADQKSLNQQIFIPIARL